MCRAKDSCSWKLAGIVSAGPSPCGSGYGIYLKIESYLDYIEDITEITLEPTEKQETKKVRTTTTTVIVPTKTTSTEFFFRNCCTEFTLSSNLATESSFQRAGSRESSSQKSDSRKIVRSNRSSSVNGMFKLVPDSEKVIKEEFEGSKVENFIEYNREDDEWTVKRVKYKEIDYWFFTATNNSKALSIRKGVFCLELHSIVQKWQLKFIK